MKRLAVFASIALVLPACQDATSPEVGEPNYALEFDQDWITIPDRAVLDLSTTWTIEAWIKPDNVTTGRFQHVLSKWNGRGNASYTLEVGRTGHLRSGIHDGVHGTQWFESDGTLASGEWHHVGITLAGGTLRLFIDGVPDGTLTDSQTPMNSDRPLSFGREGPPCGCWPYLGLIDEVRIWNVARSPSEIASAMSSRLDGSESGLVGYWQFDEGSGDSVYDATGNGLTGRLGSTDGPDCQDPAWVPWG